jgi:tripeptide aminopeptidase
MVLHDRPSTAKQLDLCRLPKPSARKWGCGRAFEFGIVMATLLGRSAASAVARLAHVDTSPETSAMGSKPIVSPYAGRHRASRDPSKIIRTADNPDLEQLVGTTIITTDEPRCSGPTTGRVAVIMSAARLRPHPESARPHPPVLHLRRNRARVDHIDCRSGPYAYTLDGEAGMVDLDVLCLIRQS